jgi:predicted RND superfamily exporter protein
MNPLYKFRNFLNQLSVFSFKHHKFSIFLSLTLLLGLLSLMKPLNVYITIDKLINSNFETSQDYFRLKDEFKLGITSLIVFEKDQSSFNQADLCSIRKWAVTAPLKIKNINNSFSPLFLRRTEYIHSTDSFDQLFFKNIIELNCDKTAEIESPLKRIDQTPWKNLLVRSDQKDFMHEFNLIDTGEKDFEVRVVPEITQQLMDSFASLKLPFKSHWMGDATYQYYMARGLAINNALNIVIAIIIMISFRCFFGTWLSGFIFLATLVYSSLVLFSLMSLTGTPIDILNNCLVLLLTVSSLGDFAFLSHHLTYNATPGEHWIKSFRSIILPSFFTSLTTFLGFVSLCTSDINVIKRLGFWAGLSGAIEWLVVMILLPPFLKVFLKNKSWVNKEKTINFLPIKYLGQITLPKKWSMFGVSLILLLPFTFHHILISDIPSNLFKKDNPFRQGIQYLAETRGFKGDISLVFNDKNNIDFNNKIIKSLSTYSNIQRIENPYDIKSFFIEGLADGRHDDQKKLVLDSLKETNQYQRFFSNQRARAIIYLKEIEMKDINQMRILVKRNLCPNNECSLSGALVAYADFSQQVPNTLLDSFVLSLGLVFIVILILAYYTGNISRFIPLFTTSFWGVAITLILMAAIQVRVNFVTCVVVSILVGMTGDNTIQYILSAMDDESENKNQNLKLGIELRSGGSLITTFIMMTCSLIFLFYYFEPPRVFGLLLFFGFFASLAGDLWLLKGLLPKENSSGNKSS